MRTKHDILSELSDVEAVAHMRAGIAAIDGALGKGYAAQHPELIAAFMRTAAQHLQTSTFREVVSEEIASALERISNNVRSDHPLQGCTLEGLDNIAQALSDISAMLDLYACGRAPHLVPKEVG